MNNLNINLLMEQVYLNGQVNKIYENILNEEEDIDSDDVSTVKKVLNELGIGSKFIFQFGTGIGAFIRPVTELLENQNVSMTKEEVALLLITAFSVLISHSTVEVGRLRKAVADKGLDSYLTDVTKFIFNTKKLMVVIGEKIGRTIHTVTDVLSFTFMLAPTMNILKDIINMNGITADSMGQLLGGLTLAASGYGVKTIVDKITNKITKKGT
jgi:hypothetical protein